MSDAPKPPPLALVPDQVLPPEAPAVPAVRETFPLEPGHAAEAAVAKPSPRQEAADRLAKRIRARAERTMAAIGRAREIGDTLEDENGNPVLDADGRPLPVQKPPGWTAAEFRVARDARRTGREAPVYLDIQKDIWKTLTKADAAMRKPEAPPLNLVVAHVNVTVNYPTKEIDGE